MSGTYEDFPGLALAHPHQAFRGGAPGSEDLYARFHQIENWRQRVHRPASSLGQGGPFRERAIVRAHNEQRRRIDQVKRLA